MSTATRVSKTCALEWDCKGLCLRPLEKC
jgi:hypothetical protein